MRRANRLVLAVTTAVTCTMAAGHETDQYTVPVGREFADLRLYFSNKFHDALQSAVDRTNVRIKRSLHHGQPTGQTSRLHSPEVVAFAVLTEFPPVINQIELLEIDLHGPRMRDRYPGLIVAHYPVRWIYHHWALLLDFTKLVRLARCSTVMVDGVYFGTDKIAHFVHMGYLYHTAYQKAIANGLDTMEATRRAVALGTGGNPFLSEEGLLGMVTTGVRSNADLAANFAGFKFYQNLTESVRIRGEPRPPLLVREGVYWRLNDHVQPHSDFSSIFITDHWNEALNPNVYAPGIGRWIRDELQKRCDDLFIWYRDEHGRVRSEKHYREIAERLSTYYGEDYGHRGDLENMVSIANVCFDTQEAGGLTLPPDASRVESFTWRAETSRTEHAVPPVTGPATSDSARRAAVHEPDEYGRTPLWWAACDGDAEETYGLIALEADVNAGDIDDERPLHCAARWGRASVAEVLLTNGADPNVKGAYGLTPLHLAARELRIDVVRVLLELGAMPAARDVFGCTPLHDVAARDDSRLAAMLIAAGADPDAQDEYGSTPLHCAARAGHVELVTLLLSNGADPMIVNDLGHTPHDEAVFGEYDEVLDCLAGKTGRGRLSASEVIDKERM